MEYLSSEIGPETTRDTLLDLERWLHMGIRNGELGEDSQRLLAYIKFEFTQRRIDALKVADKIHRDTGRFATRMACTGL